MSNVIGIGDKRAVMYDRKRIPIIVKYDNRGGEVRELEGKDLTLAIAERYAEIYDSVTGAKENLMGLQKELEAAEKALQNQQNAKQLLEEALVAHQKGGLETISEKDLHERCL